MTYVLILLLWIFIALLVSVVFGAICRAGAAAREASFPAAQDEQPPVHDAHGFSGTRH